MTPRIPRRRVLALCALSGETVPTQAFWTPREFARAGTTLAFWCPACRNPHEAGPGSLWLEGLDEPFGGGAGGAGGLARALGESRRP